MTGIDLQEKLNYIGMEKAARKLAVEDKLAAVEEIATMSEEEVCELLAEAEKVGLVKNKDFEAVEKLIKILSR